MVMKTDPKFPERLNLSFLPTPVYKTSYNGHDFLIKRDDLTGLEASGNKIRKLDYLLAEAQLKSADIIFTAGGIQSNHARATAVAAASLGIEVRLFLWGEDSLNPTGNLFINKFLGAGMRFLDYNEFLNANEIMQKEAAEFEASGRRVYIIPEGGSSVTGIHGYISFWDELSKQVDLNQLKQIWIAAGSGGTAAGLYIGACRKNLPIQINAVSVLYSEEILTAKIGSLLKGYGEMYGVLPSTSSQLNIIGGYSSEGYKKITPEKVAVLRDFARTTGIILDPIYTGKAFFAFMDTIKNGGETDGTMFLHTGGLFGVFDKTSEYLAQM